MNGTCIPPGEAGRRPEQQDRGGGAGARAGEFWTCAAISGVLGGTWIVEPAEPGGSALAAGVSTDSRSIQKGQAFIALRGDRLDGHDYLLQATTGGAGLLVVDSPGKVPRELSSGRSTPILCVPDTGLALLRLAAAWRRTLDGTPVVAITGSNGKTTTTRLVEAVLSSLGPGTASIKSFNNRVGVPLTILRATPSDRFLVCEVGTNAIGEIAELAAVIEPDLTVITSIGREHLEGLGGIQGSVREAVELIRSLRPGGRAIVPTECPELDQAIAEVVSARRTGPVQILRVGTSQGASDRIGGIAVDDDGVSFSIGDSEPFQVPLIGEHNAHNAACAVLVGRMLGLGDQAIAGALSQARGAEMRLERLRVVRAPGEAPIEVINDAYNANPESMLAAISTFKSLFGGSSRRKVAVLGDMLELGEHGPDCHREIGDAVASSGAFDLCVLVGPLMMFAGERIGKSIAPDRVVPVGLLDDKTAQRVAAMLRPGDAVLLKGSRGMGVDRVLGALTSSKA